MFTKLSSCYKALLFLLILLSYTFSNTQIVKAQLGDAGEILRTSTEDANLLMQNYFKPLGKGFGSNLNSGWVNSAKPYRTLGFDLRIDASVALVPGADEIFNVATIGLSPNVQIDGNPVTSTAVGDVNGPVLSRTETVTNPFTQEQIQTELFSFELPRGYGTPLVPSPMIQLTVGLIKDTDVTLRYIPDISIPGVDDLNVKLIGFGVKHGLNQWLPGGSMLPVDISIQAGFTNFDASIDFEVLPNVDPNNPDIENPFTDDVWQGQRAAIETNAFTGNILVGKNFPIIALWGGVGFQTSTVSFRTPGAFPVILPNDEFQQNPMGNKPFIISRVDDPIDFDIDGANTVHGMAGLRVRLAIFTISASYTLSNYQIANLGVGISFR